MRKLNIVSKVFSYLQYLIWLSTFSDDQDEIL